MQIHWRTMVSVERAITYATRDLVIHTIVQ